MNIYFQVEGLEIESATLSLETRSRRIDDDTSGSSSVNVTVPYLNMVIGGKTLRVELPLELESGDVGPQLSQWVESHGGKLGGASARI